MNEQTKNNSNNAFLIIVILALLGFVFYWFGIRTSNIRKECSRYAMVKSVQTYPSSKVEDTTERTELQEAIEEKLYENCLAERGLK